VLFAKPDGPAALGALPDDLTREQSLRWFGGLAGAAQLGWTAPQLCNPKLRARLGRIGAPTLLVWGREDQVAPVAQADAWGSGLREAQVDVLDRGGHAVTLEQPVGVARAISTFLGRSPEAIELGR
jgi:pimeloyl-ACP methyl ester carboxylesterase